MTRHRLLCIPFIALGMAIGCGGSDKPVRVTGTVRSQGKPVPNLVVHFVPEQGRDSRGTTDDNGAFKLSYERDVEGAVRGKHKVYFEFRPRTPLQESELQASLPTEMKAILDKYGKTTSSLTIEVTKDGQEIPIELE